MARPRMHFCFFALSVLIAGCGSSDPLNRQEVSGTINVNGTPLANGTIEFVPDVPEGVSSGAVIAAGTFTIPAEKGLPPGEYVVRISSADDDAEPLAMPGESNAIAQELIPPEYNADSKQKFTVQDGEENVFTLDIPGNTGTK